MPAGSGVKNSDEPLNVNRPQPNESIYSITGQGESFLALPLFQRPGLKVILWKQKRLLPQKMYFKVHKPHIELEFHLKGQNRYIISNEGGPSLPAISRAGLWTVNLFHECEGQIENLPDEKGLSLSVILEPNELIKYSSYVAGLLLPILEKNRNITLHNPTLESGPINSPMYAVVSQILECPYTGVVREFFMEAKTMELISQQLFLMNQTGGSRLESMIERKEAKAVRKAREILLADLNHPPKLGDLAKQVGLNRNKLNRGFRDLYGLTAFEMLRAEKLERAKAFLNSSRMSLAEIAQASGYCAQSHFTSAFTAQFGVPPGQYRKESHR